MMVEELEEKVRRKSLVVSVVSSGVVSTMLGCLNLGKVS